MNAQGGYSVKTTCMKQMITALLVILSFATNLPLCAQQKGAAPLNPVGAFPNPQSTRAVVVGISDYQSPQIPDLRFADRDAEAFAEWLQSKAGGSLPKEQIQTLLNGQATFGNIVSALEWLIDASGEGDVAIIYFSGHGDVESKKRSEPGFLLPFDSPPVSYMAGAYPLYYLQLVIETLSLDKGARVVVVADACRAGKLAGASIGGAAVTAANLARQVANEVKILSCQSNEFSIEGEQWGGGRGVFSYHLVDGLTGLADQNADGRVSLHELDRYIGDKVPAETAPLNQIPMTLGDRQSSLALVDAPSLEALRKTRAQQTQALEQVAAKGVGVQEVLANADTTVLRLYEQFQLALKNGDLLAPAGHCANDLYLLLEKDQQLQPLLGVMRRNLAAALQNEVQQTLNALLESDPELMTVWQKNPTPYELYPAYLQRALELLGENHYLRNSLLSKKLYFEADLLKNRSLDKEADPQVRDSLRQVVKNMLLEAIRLEDRAAYLYWAIGSLYFANNPFRTDSLEAWNRKALDLSPHWLVPILDIADEYQNSWTDMKNTEKWMNEAYQIAPESYFVIERMAWLRQWQGRLDEAVELCHRMIALKPGLYNGYHALGYTYWMSMEPQLSLEWALKSLNYTRNTWSHQIVIWAYMLTRRPELALIHAHTLESEKGLTIGSKEWAYARLSSYLLDYRKYDEAESFIRRVQASGKYAACLVVARSAEGRIAWHRGEPERARQLFESAFSLDPSNNACFSEINAWLGKLEAEKGRVKQADSLFQKAIGTRSGSFMDDFEPQAEAHYRYGLFLLAQNRLAEAKTMFEKANEWHSQRGWKGWHGLALLAARQGEREQALDFLEKSLDFYFPIPGPIMEEPLFKKIRKTKRFKAMMEKYFPPTSLENQFKD